MRGIKPEFWTDGEVASLSPLARLLFIGSWHYCCDQGHLMAKPIDLKIRVLPLDNCNVEELVDEILSKDGLMVRDEAGLTIPGIPKHQQIHSRWTTKCPRCDTSGTTVADNGSTTVDHGETTDEVNRSEVKGSEVKGGTRTRGTRLPDIFPITDEMAAWGREKAPLVDAPREHEKFCDYFRGAPGSKGVKRDWLATWRNWMRRAQEDAERRAPKSPVRDDLPEWMQA